MRRVLLALVLLAAACAGDDGETSAPAPAFTEQGTTLIVAPGYGPLYALDVDNGVGQVFPDTDGVPGDHPHRLVALDDGVAIPGGDTVRFLPWDLAGPSRSLGTSSVDVPSGRPDRLWLVSTGSRRVTEVDGSGRVTVPSTELLGTMSALGGVADSLVVLYGTPPTPLGLFTPGEPTVRPLDGQELLDTRGDLLAMTLPCDPCNRVQLLDVADGSLVEAQLDGYPFGSAFSPDGRTFAAWVQVGGRGRLELVDRASGRVQVVRAGDAGRYGLLTWSADGRSVLVLARGVSSEPTLVRYWLGDNVATTTPLPGLQAGELVAVPPGEGPHLDPTTRTPCPDAGGQDHNTNPLPALTTDGPCRLP